jgi:hypothetical protein
VNNNTQASRLALSHHFTDSPINRSKANSTQQLQATKNRSQSIIKPASSWLILRLIDRLVIVLSPNSPRAINHYNANLQKVSEKVDNLLMALRKKETETVDTTQVGSMIKNLQQNSSALASLSNSSNSTSAIVSTRIKASLEDMSDADLNALKEGVTVSKKSQLKDEASCKAYLNIISTQLEAEIQTRLVRNSVIFKTLIEEAIVASAKTGGQNQAVVNTIYENLCLEADAQLLRHDLLTGSAEERQKLRSSLLVSSFEQFLTSAEDSQQAAIDTGNFLRFLSSKALKSFDTEGVFKEDTFTMQRMISGLSSVFSDRLEQSWIDSAQIMLMTAKPTHADQFVADFVKLSTIQTELDQHNQLWGAVSDGATQESREEMDKLKEELNQKLGDYLALEKLNQPQLLVLQAALETLKLPISPVLQTQISQALTGS